MEKNVKTVKLIVKGRVQRVGYRNMVSQIADKLDITGEVRNLENGTTEIIARGKSENIERFCKKIKIQEWPIQVKGITQERITETKNYEYFNIIRGDLQKETAERADVAALYLQKINQEGAKEETSAKEKTLKSVEEKMAKEITLQEFKKEAAKEATTSKETTLEKFTNQTNTEFKGLDVKYGSISQKLDRIADSMEKLTTALLEIAHK